MEKMKFLLPDEENETTDPEMSNEILPVTERIYV